MDVNEVFELVKYRANKAGYNGYISSNDFNLLFPRAEIRYYNKLFGNQNSYQIGNPIPPIAYPGTLKVSTSLSKFVSDPTSITIDGNGKFDKPEDYFYVDSLRKGNLPIKRVEQQDLASNLNSYYEAPTADFPIYVEYSTYLQFYPTNLASATLTYLTKPTQTTWAYTLNGSLGVLNNLEGGTGYVNGTYQNVALTGGTGNSAMATIAVSGGEVISVTIAANGFQYKVGDTLSASNANLGGTGSGFSIDVASIVNGRQVYTTTGSVDPKWSDTDIDEIIYIMLSDIGVNMRDNELEAFSQAKINTGI